MSITPTGRGYYSVMVNTPWISQTHVPQNTISDIDAFEKDVRMENGEVA